MEGMGYIQCFFTKLPVPPHATGVFLGGLGKRTVTAFTYKEEVQLGESFEVNIIMYQESLLSSLLFTVGMDVVSSETRSSLASELLYADDLVLVAPTMVQLSRYLAERSLNLIDKGFTVNVGKSKLIVGKVIFFIWWRHS